MDFISTALVSLTQPTGFWETILNSFKSATGTYILAVILIALIVRVLFSVVDIVNKKVNMKQMNMNATMKPELDAIKNKYGHDERLMQQKTSEVYKKHQFSMMGSCLPMLVTMVLQFTVFLTLWNSLQAVSNYNIVYQYENMKYLYANVIELNGEVGNSLKIEIDKMKTDGKTYGEDYSIDVNLDMEAKTLKILIVEPNVTHETIEIEYKTTWTNEDIFNLLDTFVIVPPVEPPVEPENPEVGTSAYVETTYNEIFKSVAQKTAEKYYKDTQEGFLWIKNIYKAESPTSPLFTKSEITNYLSKFYSKEEIEIEKEFKFEEKIFDNVVAGIDTKSLGVNGYYILTILAVVTSFLSMYLSNMLMKGKNKTATVSANGMPAAPGQGKMMYFIMPVIIGIFTFMYTSLFAVYLIVGQLVMMALTPLTTLIVRKWLAAEGKKKKQKDVIEVDYRRK